MINTTCSVIGCDKEPRCNKMCQQHYDRKRRYGDTYTRPKKLKCQDCKIVFDVRPFGSLPNWCDDCAHKRHRAKTRADRWRKGLWEYYKITPDEYMEMHRKQNGVCLICKGTAVGRGKAKNRLAVDHNHETGKIRGLLCAKCNTGLGLFNDSKQLLVKAIEYLKERD
jgi:hypothetical protein